MTEIKTAQEDSRKRVGRAGDDVYRIIKEKVILFKIRPEERVNESELSVTLGVSRTPLREALYRLVAENMLTVIPNKGFYGRKLVSQEVFDLYELRKMLEKSAIELSLQRAKDESISNLRQDWASVMQEAETRSNLELVKDDEDFHYQLALLSGNKEIANSLASVNERIRFFRWVDLEEHRTELAELHEDHFDILDALASRDAGKCDALIHKHISQRMEDIIAFIKAGVIRLYAPD